MRLSSFLFTALILFVPAVTASAEPILTNADYSKINSNIEKHIESKVQFTGKIGNAQNLGDNFGYVLMLGSELLGDLIWIESTLNPTLEKNTCYIIEGKITGTNTLSLLNQELGKVPQMDLWEFDKIKCIDAQSPATHSIMIDETQQSDNARVTVEKIELSDDHTRVFLSIENLNSDVDLSLNIDGSIFVQDQKQFKYAILPFVEFDKINRVIPPEIIEDGYFLKERIEPKEFEFRLYLYEDGLDKHEFVFNGDFTENMVSLQPFEHDFKDAIPDKTTHDPISDLKDTQCGSGTELIDGICQLSKIQSNNNAKLGFLDWLFSWFK